MSQRTREFQKHICAYFYRPSQRKTPWNLIHGFHYLQFLAVVWFVAVRKAVQKMSSCFTDIESLINSADIITELLIVFYRSLSWLAMDEGRGRKISIYPSNSWRMLFAHPFASFSSQGTYLWEQAAERRYHAAIPTGNIPFQFYSRTEKCHHKPRRVAWKLDREAVILLSWCLPIT